jgi:hypothetical protein
LKSISKITELPPICKDPCDLFIIAIALVRRLPVVTGYSHFDGYGVKVWISSFNKWGAHTGLGYLLDQKIRLLSLKNFFFKSSDNALKISYHAVIRHPEYRRFFILVYCDHCAGPADAGYMLERAADTQG